MEERMEDTLAEEVDTDESILPAIGSVSFETDIGGTPSTRSKNYFTWAEGLKLILKSYCHCWDRARKHTSY